MTYESRYFNIDDQLQWGATVRNGKELGGGWVNGSDPETAVANLWLALNTK